METQNDPNATITVTVPGRRLRWLCSQLDAAGVVYHVQRSGHDYTLSTWQSAAPTVARVLDYTPQTAQPAPKRRTLGGLVYNATGWFIGFVVFGVAFTAYNVAGMLNDWPTIPQMLNLSAPATAIAFGVFIVAVTIWFKLAVGRGPAGYRPLISDWAIIGAVLLIGALAAAAIWTGVLR